MKRIPASLINKPNDTPMNLDQYNVAHARATHRSGPHLTACSTQGQPVTLAQAITWASGWCSRCLSSRVRTGDADATTDV
jgi:hypothetical protein